MKKASDKKWLIAGGALFSIFIVNIIASKIVLSLNNKSFPVIGDVWEFLILFIAAICFVVAILGEESEST